MKYIFTFGSEGHPYFGGWTEVIAPNLEAACAAFRAIHPDKIEGLLNCCGIYSEKEFNKTSMAGPEGNLNRRCHETITLKVDVH